MGIETILKRAERWGSISKPHFKTPRNAYVSVHRDLEQKERRKEKKKRKRKDKKKETRKIGIARRRRCSVLRRC